MHFSPNPFKIATKYENIYSFRALVPKEVLRVDVIMKATDIIH